ncbi:mannose-6-phosphate isomerase, class I [Streptomyces sp. SP18CS02]|uniref:mannose-6-phosphate isomerase, class I n=1 Tax=Streptomyces sp. SP18CS02 TaxID=3002531 RepID=UPI002E79E772|nr:mannose-6-phosphate isomerase, class I [Streptomyces sp. SP18CS02]MEE1756435.1 mannose-6-phosphate isomerase, class I [Streptomyces sp. SP18CS02]
MDRLINTVRPYAWGSTTALPELMGVEPDGTPQAELWMGAHPAAPSLVERAGRTQPLHHVVGDDPAAELGAVTLRRFGPRLPFLLKLLAADAPLSLQVHPDLAQAGAGFALENAEGVPLDAPHRNYRDGNHKPEMIVALTPFDGLCGFRAPGECAGLLGALGLEELEPYRAALATSPEEPALREVFSTFLEQGAGLVEAVARAVAREARGDGPHRAAFAVHDSIARAHPRDPGLLAALMLRHVRLAPGEGLFLGAGVPHAYLRGLGVEIMADSDNVLRCGLTPKHVDLAELLRVVRFSASPVRIARPTVREDGEEVFPAPVDDFRLSVLRPGARRPAFPLDDLTPQILVCTEGRVLVTGGGGELDLSPGDSVYVPAGEPVTVTGRGTVFRATVAAGRTGTPSRVAPER